MNPGGSSNLGEKPRPKKILLIDDEKSLVYILAEILKKNGYEVVTALNGLDGLETAFREDPDLILLDVTMPGLDGWGVLKRLKLDNRTRNTRIVMLTADRETHSIFQSEGLHASDYFMKPVKADELLSCIRKYI